MPRGIDVERAVLASARSFGVWGAGSPWDWKRDRRPTRHRATAASEAAPVESRGASPPPAPQPPAATTPDLPEFAKKADDLEAIKKAVDDAASVGGGLWLSYLFVLFYLAVAAGAMTNVDLFLEKPVKLPFLNIELPLLAFFFLAPMLSLVVHAYTLVHLVMLTDNARRYDYGDALVHPH